MSQMRIKTKLENFFPVRKDTSLEKVFIIEPLFWGIKKNDDWTLFLTFIIYFLFYNY